MKKGKLLFLFVIGILLISFINLNYAQELKVTGEHPFLINGDWIPAKELNLGDKLKTISGEKAVITKIAKIVPLNPIKVYNLEAGVYHNFVVEDDIVVHNSDIPVNDVSIDVPLVFWTNFFKKMDIYLKKPGDLMPISYSGDKPPLSLLKRIAKKSVSSEYGIVKTSKGNSYLVLGETNSVSFENVKCRLTSGETIVYNWHSHKGPNIIPSGPTTYESLTNSIFGNDLLYFADGSIQEFSIGTWRNGEYFDFTYKPLSKDLYDKFKKCPRWRQIGSERYNVPVMERIIGPNWVDLIPYLTGELFSY